MGGVEFNPGAGPRPGVDPDTYAAEYANEHGITIEQAKVELRAKYGDPQQHGMSMNEGLVKMEAEESTGEIPKTRIPEDPEKLEAFIQKGAKEAGCTPEEFAEMMGIEPKPNTENGTSERLSRNDKKAWIKNYQQEHGCTKKEATKAFDDQYALNVMSRKDAKSWCEGYMEQTGCSKKDAKKAFKEQFGYSVPNSKFAQAAKVIGFGTIAAPVTFAAGVFGGPVGFLVAGGIAGAGIGQSVSGNSNDQIYQKRT